MTSRETLDPFARLRHAWPWPPTKIVATEDLARQILDDPEFSRAASAVVALGGREDAPGFDGHSSAEAFAASLDVLRLLLSMPSTMQSEGPSAAPHEVDEVPHVGGGLARRLIPITGTLAYLTPGETLYDIAELAGQGLWALRWVEAVGVNHLGLFEPDYTPAALDQIEAVLGGFEELHEARVLSRLLFANLQRARERVSALEQRLAWESQARRAAERRCADGGRP